MEEKRKVEVTIIVTAAEALFVLILAMITQQDEFI
jgi:hypothetical protein